MQQQVAAVQSQIEFGQIERDILPHGGVNTV